MLEFNFSTRLDLNFKIFQLDLTQSVKERDSRRKMILMKNQFQKESSEQLK